MKDGLDKQVNKLNKYLLLLLISLSSVWSQGGEISVLGIEVEGNVRLSKDDIMRSSRLYDGMTIKSDEIQRGIKRLWKLNRFSDIQIYLDEETYEGVYLRIVVNELPVLSKLTFQGNKKIKDNPLSEVIELQPGNILSEYAIFEAIQSIKSAYKEKHYHNVKIDTLTSAGEMEFSKHLTFIITENKKVKVKKIIINGNEAFSDRVIIKQFDTKPKSLFMFWRGKYDENIFSLDKDNLGAFYRNHGYIDFQIVNDSIESTADGKGLEINLSVYEGPKYYFRNISWEGNTVHDNETLSAYFGYEKGDVYNEEKFQIALSEGVSALYMDDGYFYFQAIPQITPVGEDSIDVHFVITENEIVKVRKILITGNEKTHENVIRRELRVFPGDIFNRKKLMDSYRDIFMLNFFENVIPDVVPVNEQQIDITLDVLEKSTGMANFSMGYNEVHGLTGGGGFEFPNFRGRGQTLSISYQRGVQNQQQYQSTSSVADYQSFSLSYTDPWLFDTPNLVGISYSYTERGRSQNNFQSYDITQNGGSLRWGRRFKWPDPFFRGSWMLKATNTKYYTENESELEDDFGEDIHQDGDRWFASRSGISLTQIITRDSRNHPEFPTAGSKFVWTTTFSGSFLGGNENYHKHNFDFNWFTPLAKKFVMHQTLKFGAFKVLSSKNDEVTFIPYNARYIMGGTGIPYGEMLRGYPDNMIGPLSTTSYRPGGGKILMKYSMEFRLSLSESPTIFALAFAEAGNIYNDFNEADPFQLMRSAGVGIRLFMPMLGVLGYDMGYGFDSLFDDGAPHEWEHHLIFGMPF